MNLRPALEPENFLRAVVGLRPYRQGSARMEIERNSGKLWAHNYGHGGSGITLCWGASRFVVEALCRELPESTKIAVLGAGAMGLCCATLLLQKGHQICIYAQDFPPHTTSDIAGGLWAPTHIGQSGDAEQYRQILEWSWRGFEALETKDYGVQRVPLYEALDCPYPLDPLPTWLLGDGRSVKRLPISSQAPPGKVWSTFLVETDSFLKKLVEDVLALGGQLKKHRFRDRRELHELPERTLVNCLGLGAGKLLQDSALLPIRGQLLYFKPVEESFILDHSQGYIISRPDRLILGGTFEENISELEPCPETTKKILQGARDFPWDAAPKSSS